MPTESPPFINKSGKLFSSTQIPVCLPFLAKSENTDAKRDFRDRRTQTLFIAARKLGTLNSQTSSTRRSLQSSAGFRGRRKCAALPVTRFCRYLSPAFAQKPTFV